MRLLLSICFLVMTSHTATAVPANQAVRDAIVKIYTVHKSPDYYNPWSMHGSRQSTGSGCIIKGKKILTNAHVVSDQTFVQIRKNGQSKRYTARVLNVSHHADLALLTVDDPKFFENTTPLDIGELPESQKEVLVYGFPLGGDSLSITKGVISRIEHRVYAHSSCYLFAGQIDAAINPGNSGGPVCIDGKIVGVVMQGLTQADNIGYMVPVPVLEHFVTDIEDGKYDGFPSLGIVMQSMENPDMKRKYGMKDTQTGMLVYKVVPGSVADGIILEDDVLLAIDGTPIADDGTVEFREKERTAVAYCVQVHQVGEESKLSILRGGELQELAINLSRSMEADWLIYNEGYDDLPTYYIYGGIVFSPLTKNFLLAWGRNWGSSAPRDLVTLMNFNYKKEDVDEVILAVKVLPADVNQGYYGFMHRKIKEVNGQQVRNLKHMIHIIESSVNDEYITIKDERGEKVILDRKKVEDSHAQILQTYRIREDRSEDLKTASPLPGLTPEPAPAM